MIRACIHPDFDSWRQKSRELLQADVLPENTLWTEQGEWVLPLANVRLESPFFLQHANEENGTTDPKTTTLPDNILADSAVKKVRVSREFISICRRVACHRDADRWSLMYRLLWRLTHGESHLLHVLVDPDVYRLTMMEKAVRRDRHKMTAFVRFRNVIDADGERFVAWHKPDHHIVRLTAPFFAERFAALRWTILTPDESVSWDGHALAFGPGVPRSDAPRPDELESLWKTYYGSIFNPARVNLVAMRKEMPIRHWDTLPETEIINELLHDAPRRIEEMVARTRSSERARISAIPTISAALSLPQLRAAATSCKGCKLHCNATQTVFGEGPANAKLVFVGEQPGDEEDRNGRPFIGPAGQLFNEMLQQAGINREEVYVTNTVKHFKWEPRGNRRIHKTPSSREVVACTPWLEAELNLIRPQMLVCLGATASRAVFGREFQLSRERGKPRETRWAPYTVAIWHPSALLRIPDAAKRAEVREQFARDLHAVAGQFA